MVAKLNDCDGCKRFGDGCPVITGVPVYRGLVRKV